MCAHADTHAQDAAAKQHQLCFAHTPSFSALCSLTHTVLECRTLQACVVYDLCKRLEKQTCWSPFSCSGSEGLLKAMIARSNTSSTSPCLMDTTLQVRLRCTKLGSAEGGSVMLAVPEQWPAR